MDLTAAELSTVKSSSTFLRAASPQRGGVCSRTHTHTGNRVCGVCCASGGRLLFDRSLAGICPRHRGLSHSEGAVSQSLRLCETIVNVSRRRQKSRRKWIFLKTRVNGISCVLSLNSIKLSEKCATVIFSGLYYSTLY